MRLCLCALWGLHADCSVRTGLEDLVGQRNASPNMLFVCLQTKDVIHIGILHQLVCARRFAFFSTARRVLSLHSLRAAEMPPFVVLSEK